MTDEHKRRRRFLQAGLSVAGGAVVGLFARKSASVEASETVRLMQPDGTMVTVESRHITQLSEVLSNDEFDKWKATGKQ